MSEEESNNYSSFWPLCIFFAGVIFADSFQLYQLSNQRTALLKQQDYQVAPTQQSAEIQKTLTDVVNDLVELSRTDNTAAELVKENIRQNPAPASGSGTPPSPTPEK